MQHKHTLQGLIKSIKQKQLRANPNSYSRSTEELKIKLAQCQRSYDELLLESLSLIEIVDELNNKSSEEYDVLVEELEREKQDRKEDVKELQENVEMSGTRLENLKVMIGEKQVENMALRAQIQQKEQRILQLQQDARQNLAKIQLSYTNRMEEQILAHAKQKQEEITKITCQFEAKIKKIQQQTQIYLNQNELLSNRLEQIMKYVQERETQEVVEDQISPRILYNFREQYSPQSQNHLSSQSACSSRLDSNFQKEEENSQQTNSPHRVVLHEILNTEDRKSINFGGSSILSRHRQYQQNSYGQNNINTLNRLECSKQKSKQKLVPKMNIIQQFKAEETVTQDPNPYFIFFTLISQCAKIDSGDLEHVAVMDLSPEWDNFLRDRIPLHEWYPALKQKIKDRI